MYSSEGFNSCRLEKLTPCLSEKHFTGDQLNAAIFQLTNVEITANIISLIRRCALGAELLVHEEKINCVVAGLKANYDFSSIELKWLDRIEKFLRRESLINPSVFDETGSHFKDAGGFKRIDKIFGGKLWNLCNVLRDDGITYHQYVTERTYILFLKMESETGTEEKIPKGYRLENLSTKSGSELKKFTRRVIQH